MRLPWAAILALVCGGTGVNATTCAYPEPCASIGPDSIQFTGVLVSGEVISASRNNPAYDLQFRIGEVFSGLPPGTKTVTIRSGYAWLPGKTYFIQAGKGRDGRIHAALCSRSGEISDQSVAPIVEYLRLRAQRKTATSLRVFVSDPMRPVAGAHVLVNGPHGVLSRVTDAKGYADFGTVTPGSYHISAAASGYQGEKEAEARIDLTVPYGACESASLTLMPDTVVSGRVQDAAGAPVARQVVELVAAPDVKTNALRLEFGYRTAQTDSEGRFVFEAVSPGRYILGVDILGAGSSSVSPTYYPGQRVRQRAVPLHVEAGGRLENLRFVLPEYRAKP